MPVTSDEDARYSAIRSPLRIGTQIGRSSTEGTLELHNPAKRNQGTAFGVQRTKPSSQVDSSRTQCSAAFSPSMLANILVKN